MAFCGLERRDVVDVGGGGEEQDALDGFGGEGLAGGGVKDLHCML